jgi:hypothetical protein
MMQHPNKICARQREREAKFSFKVLIQGHVGMTTNFYMKLSLASDGDNH